MDVLAELKAIALGKLRLSLEDFYELTPVELHLIFEKHKESTSEFFHLMQVANYVGFGQASNGKKFKSVFLKSQNSKKETAPKRVSYEQKMKELEELQKRLRGR